MSQIEIWEGQRFAAQMIEQASHLPKCMFDGCGPVETMVRNLEAASKVHPADYAKGIRLVIEVPAMSAAELHGRSITPFDQGFLAFIKGISPKDNPFDGEKSPVSNHRWAAGWNKAQREAGRKA